MRNALIALLTVISLTASAASVPVGAAAPEEAWGGIAQDGIVQKEAVQANSWLVDAMSINDILAADDYRWSDGDILRLYQAFFERLPDVEGTLYWIGIARNGATLDEIAEWFTASPEFANTYAGTSDVVFLDRVYEHVLGRDYDLGGFNYWLSLMRGGLSRGAVVRWVAANDEFINNYPFAPRVADTNTYYTIYDESGSISVDVPTHWNDVDRRGWRQDDLGTSGIIGPALSASPDLDAYVNTWGTPGVFIGASPLLWHTPAQLLNAKNFSNSCTYSGRYEYDDGVYTGLFDEYVGCGGEYNTFWVIAAEPADGSWIALVEIIAVTDADFDAADRIVATFTISGVAG